MAEGSLPPKARELGRSCREGLAAFAVDAAFLKVGHCEEPGMGSEGTPTLDPEVGSLS